MDARLRITFFCGTCLGLAIGFAAGHVSVWQRNTSVRQTRPAFYDLLDAGHSASLGGGSFDLSLPTPPLEASRPSPIPVPGGAVVLNDPDLGDEPVHAEALVEVPLSLAPATQPNPLPPAEVKPLPPSDASTPLERLFEPTQTQQTLAVGAEPAALDSGSPAQRKSPLDPEVIEMLKDELQGVSEQQREVWADALQGMSPSDAAGIILMWKKFGQRGTGPDHLSSLPPLFRSSHPDAEPASLKDSAPVPPPSLLPSPVDDLLARIERHNLANRKTCGYLEMIPVYKEVPFDSVEGAEHVRVVGYRLNTEHGTYNETGNPAHVAVMGGGFFPVKLENGEEQYTRVGRLVIDAQQRLCIDLGDQELPLSPEIKLHEGICGFTVHNNELKVVVEGEVEPDVIGQLPVAQFMDASRLLPVGGSLYRATTASGPPKRVAAELMLQTLEYPSIEGRSATTGR